MSRRPYSSSVILQGGTHAQTMQRLHVVRQYALQNLRSNPRVMLGEAQLDFTPMLNNPRALPNVAIRLQAMPQHVQVQASTSEVTEVDQGLVIHHVLTYQILPGKCADAGAKAQLAAAGMTCFTRSTMAPTRGGVQRAGQPALHCRPWKAAGGDRGIPAEERGGGCGCEPAHRRTAQIAGRSNAARGYRGQGGPGRSGAHESLSDDDLKDELINMGPQTVEETMFVPKLESSNYAHPQHTADDDRQPRGGGGSAANDAQWRAGGASPAGFPKLLKVVPGSALHLNGSGQPRGDQTADLDHGPVHLSYRLHHWPRLRMEWGVSVSINWCVVGCTSTYGIQLNAGFNYAFGLRFPIQTTPQVSNRCSPQQYGRGEVDAAVHAH